ncbi:MAG: hypothetical protein AB8B50_10310 [Pirellulaceae bacterium]
MAIGQWLQRRTPLLFLLGMIAYCNSTVAADEFSDLKTLARIPLSDWEVKAAFRESKRSICEVVSQGEPVEIRSYTSILTNLDRRKAKSKLFPSSRRTALSVGLEFESDDRADLPSLSRGQITSFVDGHYLSIQTRIRRDLLDREPFYFHRPIGVLARYRGSRVSQTFEPILRATVNDFHGLGLFVPEGGDAKDPKSLRTLVLLFRTDLMVGRLATESLECAFILGRKDRITGSLEPHVFVTTEDRTQLHYLRDGRKPITKSQASILGRAVITDFDSSGLVPKESATRSFRLRKRTSFSMSELDAACESAGKSGGVARNLTFVLNALADGKSVTDLQVP